MADDVMDAESFFGLVDEFLTPAMAELGYHRIGGSRNDQPLSRGVLSTSGASSATGEAAPFLLYDFGFEADSDGVQRLVNPEDPESAEELWLSYEPSTGELDLSAWTSIASGLVDWDPRSDAGPCSEHEVRRRLAAMGTAVATFAQSRGAD
jgi:hypothetical protein